MHEYANLNPISDISIGPFSGNTGLFRVLPSYIAFYRFFSDIYRNLTESYWASLDVTRLANFTEF